MMNSFETQVEAMLPGRVTGPHPPGNLTLNSQDKVFTFDVPTGTLGARKPASHLAQGAGWLSISKSRKSPGVWYVGEVATAPKFQRKGVASDLHDAAFEWIKRQGGDYQSGWLTSREAFLYWEKMVRVGKAIELPSESSSRPKFLRTESAFESMVEQELLERAPTAIMYHGTSGRNLKSILSKGLVPSGVPKSWADDPDASWFQPSRASLGGIYVTHNLMTAVSSSFRGTAIRKGEKRVIVVCQIQPRSLLADEDDFMHTVKGLDVPRVVVTDWGVLNLYLSSLGQGQSDRETHWLRDYDKHRNAWVEDKTRRIMNDLKGDPHPQLERRLKAILFAGFPAVVQRHAAYITDRHIRVQIVDERKVEFDLPSKSTGEGDFRKFLEQLTRTMKQLSQIDKRQSDWNVSGRLMKPIGFRGANKIVGIFQFFDDADRKTQIEPVFGKIPFMTIHEWEQSMGTWRAAA